MNYNIIEKNTGIVGYGQDIIYAEGKYFLISETPAKVCYSEDLEEWTEVELNDYYLKPRKIAYGNGIFIISGGTGSTDDTYVYYSTDGINWNPKLVNTGRDYAQSINTCKFINNKFILVANYYYYYTSTGERSRTVLQFIESKDGVSWSLHEYTYWGSRIVTQADIGYYNNIYILHYDHH